MKCTSTASTHSLMLMYDLSYVTSYRSNTPSARRKYDFAMLRNLKDVKTMERWPGSLSVTHCTSKKHSMLCSGDCMPLYPGRADS